MELIPAGSETELVISKNFARHLCVINGFECSDLIMRLNRCPKTTWFQAREFRLMNSGSWIQVPEMKVVIGAGNLLVSK